MVKPELRSTTNRSLGGLRDHMDLYLRMCVCDEGHLQAGYYCQHTGAGQEQEHSRRLETIQRQLGS